MASEVYTVVEVELQDGTLVDLRPLPIATLRKFMRIWNEHLKSIMEILAEKGEDAVTDPDVNDKQYDTYMKLAILSLERTLKDNRTTKEFENYLGEVLDEPTIFKILEVCGGLSLGKANQNQNPAMSALPTGE